MDQHLTKKNIKFRNLFLFLNFCIILLLQDEAEVQIEKVEIKAGPSKESEGIIAGEELKVSICFVKQNKTEVLSVQKDRIRPNESRYGFRE